MRRNFHDVIDMGSPQCPVMISGGFNRPLLLGPLTMITLSSLFLGGPKKCTVCNYRCDIQKDVLTANGKIVQRLQMVPAICDLRLVPKF